MVTVSTIKYEIVHGKAPGGFGSWAFSIDKEVCFISGKYGDAKKEAVAIAKSKKVHSVGVLS
ncbi:hypothetical protein CLV98_1573 [Dyadobacter jejuensis]|uniref:Uncharacterized protein n=1 Tax=Dyadobacter jejuensis TaxID=1082580 RepID=A0A315ZSJ8_9BACT|nr:hypothetical protein [Dyadobacter jejuensis]PWJ48123.1 hypothetical protein CLV98_1573 [Dyadobacter jejuensis]